MLTEIVYKYELTSEVTRLVLPKGAKILHAGIQRNITYLWVLVELGKEVETREFIQFTTGEQMESPDLSFIGTVFLFEGALVYHIFEHHLETN